MCNLCHNKSTNSGLNEQKRAIIIFPACVFDPFGTQNMILSVGYFYRMMHILFKFHNPFVFLPRTPISQTLPLFSLIIFIVNET